MMRLGGSKFIIFLTLCLFAAFIYWANITSLDLVTKGQGRVIAETDNKIVQVPDNGIIANLLVSEGDVVQSGQLIAAINPAMAESSLDEVLAERAAVTAELVRLDAEINGTDAATLAKLFNDPTEPTALSQMSLFHAKEASRLVKIQGLQQEKQQLLSEIAQYDIELQSIDQMTALLEEEKAEIIPLIDAGVLGSADRFRLERQETDLNSRAALARAKKAQINEGLALIDIEIEAVDKQFMETAMSERSDAIARLARVEAQLPAFQQRLEVTEIKAPVDGVINQMYVNSSGTVLRQGDPIAEIVPALDKLVVEAFVDPKDIGQIEPGQKARISLTAYDPTKYGYIDGILRKVSADAVYKEETRAFMYAATIEIEPQLTNTDGTEVAILPGMIAQADIIRGSRTILEYFWQPVAKIKDDAFRE